MRFGFNAKIKSVLNVKRKGNKNKDNPLKESINENGTTNDNKIGDYSSRSNTNATFLSQDECERKIQFNKIVQVIEFDDNLDRFPYRPLSYSKNEISEMCKENDEFVQKLRDSCIGDVYGFNYATLENAITKLCIIHNNRTSYNSNDDSNQNHIIKNNNDNDGVAVTVLGIENIVDIRRERRKERLVITGLKAVLKEQTKQNKIIKKKTTRVSKNDLHSKKQSLFNIYYNDITVAESYKKNGCTVECQNEAHLRAVELHHTLATLKIN